MQVRDLMDALSRMRPDADVVMSLKEIVFTHPCGENMTADPIVTIEDVRCDGRAVVITNQKLKVAKKK